VTYLWAIVMGVVQGLTEFLPVSSSGHLAFLGSFLKGFRPPGIAYEVLLHGATLLVVLIFYRRRVLGILTGFFRGEGGVERRLVFLLVIGSIPLVLAAVILGEKVEELFQSLKVVGAMWIVTALLLFIANASGAGRKDLEQITWKDALLIGFAQAFALMPGISRSGATICVALLLGVRGGAAAEFSFLLAIPAIGGALILKARGIGDIMEAPYICGAVAAFISGLIAIYLLLKVIKQRKLIYFAVYCLVLGLITLVML